MAHAWASSASCTASGSVASCCCSRSCGSSAALLLVSLIDLNGQADRARKRQLVLVQLRQASVQEAWIAFTGPGSDGLVAGRRIADLDRQMHASASRLEALGDARYAPAIDASIAGALGWTHAASALTAHGQLGRADRALRTVQPARGPRAPVHGHPRSRESLRTSPRGTPPRTARNILSVVLALVSPARLLARPRPLGARAVDAPSRSRLTSRCCSSRAAWRRRPTR